MCICHCCLSLQVIVTTADTTGLKMGLGPGILHSYEYPFYYYNIRANAANRVAKYLVKSMSASKAFVEQMKTDECETKSDPDILIPQFRFFIDKPAHQGYAFLTVQQLNRNAPGPK